jgi:LysM repeat protein
MKKISIAFLVVLTTLFALSCKTTPTAAPPKIEGEVTQEKVNTALEQIYDTYRTKLDFTGAQDYTVKSGDSLSQITRTYYSSLTGVGEAGPSNGFYFPVIMLASDSNIVDPDLIEPGMKLKIVDIQKNLSNPVSKQAIKDCLNDVAYVYNKKGVTVTEEGLKKLANSL